MVIQRQAEKNAINIYFVLKIQEINNGLVCAENSVDFPHLLVNV